MYKGEVDIKHCDTVSAGSDLINTPGFLYYNKFREILHFKPKCQDAFPHEFERY